MACTPSWNKGGCYPILPIEDQGNCDSSAGGTKTVGAPQFVLAVTNPPNLIWTDEDFTVIRSDEDSSIIVFDNL